MDVFQLKLFLRIHPVETSVNELQQDRDDNKEHTRQMNTCTHAANTHMHITCMHACTHTQSNILQTL